MTDTDPAVFFLSDYGTADEFVGVVHAVIHRLAPGVPVIDLSHQVPPFDVRAGADMLVRSAPSLGPGVVLAVVDPGVGTDRRAVALRTAGDTRQGGGPAWLVGPDNGLLIPAASWWGGVGEAWNLSAPDRDGRGPATERDGAGRTFDGRDLFAPVVAHLAVGGDPRAWGTAIDPATLLPVDGRESGPKPVGRRSTSSQGPVADHMSMGGAVEGTALAAPVSWIDRFGNVQLRLPGPRLEAVGLKVRAAVTVSWPAGDGGLGSRDPESISVVGRRVEAFGELGPGELGVMVDANGRVALVLDRDSASRYMGLHHAGPEVTLTPVFGDGL